MDHYMNDPFRGTGRTTRMLERAVTHSIEGFDVIVTAFTETYAFDLQHIVCSMLTRSGIPFINKRHVITIGNVEMVFTRHFRSSWDNSYYWDCSYINPGKLYLLHEDHFSGV